MKLTQKYSQFTTIFFCIFFALLLGCEPLDTTPDPEGQETHITEDGMENEADFYNEEAFDTDEGDPNRLFGWIFNIIATIFTPPPPPPPPVQYVVPGNDVSVVIETKPFRLVFKDSSGNTVLRSISNNLPLLPPVCSFTEPDTVGNFFQFPPLGLCQHYHSIHFEVGAPEAFVYQESFLFSWAIEPTSVHRNSTLHFATEVIAVQTHSGGQLITLATTLPGATIDVLVAPDPSGVEAMRITATVNGQPSGHGVQNISLAFEKAGNEAFYGFGGRRKTLDHSGENIYSWTQDAMAQYSYIPSWNINRAYGPQALFHSSNRYGFLLENSELARFYMGKERHDAWKVSVSSNSAAFVVSAGDYKNNIENITAIGGRHRPIPDWAKGFIFSHPSIVFGNIQPGEYFQKSMEHLRQFDELGIDVSGYLIEVWLSSTTITRAELEQLIAEVEARGIKPMTYMREMLSDDSEGLGTEDKDIFDYAYSNGLMPTRVDGTPYTYSLYGSETSVHDYTNPRTVDWWEDRLTEMYDLGSEGYMLDFGEQIRPDMHFYNGETGRSMHNKMPIIATKETARITDEYEQNNPGREIMYFTRGNYSGRPGTPAYEHAQFLGDNSQTWDANTGIKAVLPDMLNRGLGGAFNLSTEIGGYWDLLFPNMEKELFVRWTQLSTFVAMFRLHNSSTKGIKTPWSFDDEALQIFKSTLELRKRALLYLDEISEEAHETGLPLWRPMWLEFPNDPRFRNEMSQFMLGEQVLVAPVLDNWHRHKLVKLPAGCWQYMPTGTTYTGGGNVIVDAPLDVLPYFFKCGEPPWE